MVIRGYKVKEYVYYALLSLYLFYYSYRYIFKYNSSQTSPTYSDTPLAFQLLKYAILGCLLLVLVLQFRVTTRIPYRNRKIFLITALLIVQFIVLGGLSKNLDAISTALILVPILFYVRCGDLPSLSKVEKILMVFWWFSFTYELLQIALYVVFKRLPALAYPTGKITDVRFGGAWDDPNGYALFTLFYLFYFLVKYRGIKQFCYVGATLLMLILTWSGTGFIAFVATAVIMLLIRLNDRQLVNKYILVCGIALSLGLALFALRFDDIVRVLGHYLQSKVGSVDDHLLGWDMSWANPLTLCGLYCNYSGGEVGYLRILSIGGFPALFAYLYVSLQGCVRAHAYMINQSSQYSALLFGVLAYVVAFLLFMVNLPPLVNFSCMGVFTCFLILAFTNKETA